MKASLLVGVILATVFFLNVSASNSSSSEEGSQACRRNVQRNCSSTTKTCARLGRANICQAFKNDCQRKLSNCGSKKFYRKVDVSLCRGLPIDVVRPCGSG
ncbi:uncharacterized protein LOC117138056 isoform X2 [Drosophila mauritiana]|uniref:Uncharacterized protein LOC117138056 isoform X2 n=1 Tax=Drosophila mauritiana TaxID=7226 RepID=A0A6P8JHN4_DROMA|nr:uncharacterized protein LOC117138056 isoform X2 [Drosophila mauritiana]